MNNNPSCPACASGKTKHRDNDERRDLIHRLHRIEGQIRGITTMIETDAYCTDVITQVAAARAALDSFNRLLLERHVRTCVADGIRAGDDSVVDELNDIIKKITK